MPHHGAAPNAASGVDHGCLVSLKFFIHKRKTKSIRGKMRSRKRPYALRVAARQPITRGDGHEARHHAAADIERKGR